MILRPDFEEEADIHEWIALVADGALTADGFDDAIIGVSARSPGRESVVVYDAFECVNVLMKGDGMDREEAWEFFEFNVVGTWMGDRTPVFLDRTP